MTATRRQTRFLTYLDGSGHAVAEVGDKAARLDRLIGDGYPVPTAAVLTTAAYLEALQQQQLRLLVEDLKTSNLPDPNHRDAERAAIIRSFASAPLPARYGRAIDRVAEEILTEGPVAVRASVVDEDLGELPSAGQYLAVTNITDRTGLDSAVRSCWASVWVPEARSHRRERHMNDHHIAVAVIVQRMVNPEWCGLALSSDPDGSDHLLRIENGLEEPASFQLRKDTLEIVAGTEDPPPFLEDLARLVVRIEKTYGCPQTIDWVCDSAGLAVLQIRPLIARVEQSTLDDGLDTRPDADTYTPHGVIEMLPGVIPPLLWTINAPMLENAFRATFADLGATTPPHDRPIVARFAGKAALNLSAICQVAESLPGGNPAEVERQYLGRNVSQDTPSQSLPDERQASGAHLFAALRTRTVHKRIADDVELIATAARTIAGLDVELSDLPVRKLVAYRQRIRDLAWRGYAAEVGASSAAGATYRALELLLERWLSESEAAEWTQRLTRTAIDRSTLGGMREAGLASVLADYATPDVLEVIREPGAAPREEIATTGPAGARFLAHLDGAVQAMGSRAVYGDARWAEDDAWIWRQLQLISAAQPGPAGQAADDDEFEVLISELSQDKKWRRLRILTGQFVDLRARWLRRQVGETTRFLQLRERAKSALLILGGEERRIIMEAAERLVVSRQLPGAELVEYLTDAELDGMLFGACGVSRQTLERRMSIGAACREDAPLPDWFTEDPADHRDTDVDPRGPLEGWATSPGQATGPVCVVNSLVDSNRLRQGDVLVAHSTDPSWTPLFLAAGAVVLETGGPLSHASIVAREFGIPAVVSIPNVTQLLSDGEIVLVDGDVGKVDRLDGDGT